MVAAFLQAEIASERFGKDILALLERDGKSSDTLDRPDVDNPEENRYRIQLLGEYRGCKQNRDLFDAFPEDVSWHRCALSPGELSRVKYIDYSYWIELSGGSRLAVDAARNVRSGIEVFGQSNAGFLKAARALENGAGFPELILVGTAPDSELVVLEGHLRLTAYFLAPEHLPRELSAVVGFSPDLKNWMAL